MRNKVFGRRLRQLRCAKKISAPQMSKELGMTKNYVYNIERGYAYPSMTQFFAICEYFDLEPKEFFDWEL